MGQPPSRRVVQELFEASDVDESGGIDREEFDIIVKVSCAQIFGRMMINYATLLLVIPFVSKLIVERYLDPENPYLEMVGIQFTGMILFVVVVPMLWKIVDRGAYMEAGRQASRQRSARNLHVEDSPQSQSKKMMKDNNNIIDGDDDDDDDDEEEEVEDDASKPLTVSDKKKD